jgi:hypothetical protein
MYQALVLSWLRHFLQNIPAECRAFNDDNIAAAKPYGTRTRL